LSGSDVRRQTPSELQKNEYRLTMKPIISAESYIESKEEWADSLVLLREIIKATTLTETIKWGIPTYTLNNKNVVALSAYKSYVGIWFFNGVYLKDPAKTLINAQEGVTRGQRQWRFSAIEDIRESRILILQYLEEAIRNQKDGKVMKPQRTKAFEIPWELQKAVQESPTLKDAFNTLSLSKRREYCEYISFAKQEKTRLKRLEKIAPMIMEGMGLYDRYKK